MNSLTVFDGEALWGYATLSIEPFPRFPTASGTAPVIPSLIVSNEADDEAYEPHVDFFEELFSTSVVEEVNDPFACAACQAWYDIEIKNTTWIDDLPACPCTIVKGYIPYTVRPTDSERFTGKRDGVNWITDPCMNPKTNCGTHPGAYACIRGAGPGDTGQQCCYGAPDENGVSHLLEHGTKGAGTPDRYRTNVKNLLMDLIAARHYEHDVATYNTCCKKCPKLCELYVGKKDGTRGARSDPRHTSEGCAAP